MTVSAAVRLFAGFMLTLSLALFHTLRPWGLALTSLVGVNLLIHGTTGFCIASKVFVRVGLPSSCHAAGLNVDRGVSIGAGAVVLLGVLTGTMLLSPWPATLIVGLVAFNMAQSAFSGWCPMMTVVRRFGLPA